MRDISGYEGLYAITSCGKVWSYRRNKFLKPVIDSDGYFHVDLCKNNTHNIQKVHRLVAEVYIPNPNNFPCVNHKDEIKTNNSLNNLEWCTFLYNNTYGTARQRSSETRSKKCKCINTGKIYNSTKSAAEDIGCKNIISINRVCRGDRVSIYGLKFIYI